MKKKKIIDKKILLKLAITLLMSGYLFEGGEIDDAPQILKEMANDYKDKIREWEINQKHKDK